MLRVALDLLPVDARSRHGCLRDYFCDKDAIATIVNDKWHLELAWNGGVERHVDRRIERELLAWGGIGLAEMATAKRRTGRVLTALYDTWTLWSWCQWVARENPAADERITVLHLDDHRDLASPRLVNSGKGLCDLITGLPFDVRDPVTVHAACESGAVGMGSFLTPFLLAFPNCDVRQLGQPPKIKETRDYLVEPAAVIDELLAPGTERPAVILEPTTGVGAGHYRATNDLTAWLENIAPGPVLLHIDMDYFNNRYDGDCDWPDRYPRHDPPIGVVLDRIDAVTAAIRNAGILRRVEDAVVAFSPGFFPAEMWQPAEMRLRAGLAELYD
jgi:hypothetical protein